MSATIPLELNSLAPPRSFCRVKASTLTIFCRTKCAELAGGPVDPIAAAEIERRLVGCGIDQHVISMEVYVHAREIFILFEGLLNTAHSLHFSAKLL